MTYIGIFAVELLNFKIKWWTFHVPNLMYKLLLFILHIYITTMNWVLLYTDNFNVWINCRMFHFGQDPNRYIWARLHEKFYVWIRPYIYLLITTGTNPKNGKNDRWCCKEEERTGTWAYSYHDSSGTGS